MWKSTASFIQQPMLYCMYNKRTVHVKLYFYAKFSYFISVKLKIILSKFRVLRNSLKAVSQPHNSSVSGYQRIFMDKELTAAAFAFT